MAKPTVQEMAKKRADRFKRRERLTNQFLMEFTIGIVFCLIIWINMALWGNAAVAARGMRVWMPWVTLGLAIIAFGVKYARLEDFKKWTQMRQLVWNYFAYSFAALSALYWIIALHISFDIEAFEGVLPFMQLGNEWAALQWSYAWIGLGVVICFVKYLVAYKRAK